MLPDFRPKISAIPGQVLEITGSKIINHREVRVREFLLQRKREIRTDEAGAAGDDELRAWMWSSYFRHSERSRGIPWRN
jgi:hypothetical protein